MMTPRQKISGGFGSRERAMDFAGIRSFVSTATQGWTIIDALPATLRAWRKHSAFREPSSQPGQLRCFRLAIGHAMDDLNLRLPGFR
jgi:hypothetical protein